MKYLRRLYDWVLGWADTPYGGLALVLIAFAESSFFPIPPDVLLIALCLGSREKWLRFAVLCSAASIVGGMVGYAIGWGIWSTVDSYFFTYVPGFTTAQFSLVRDLYEKYNFWIVFVAAFTPIPYKVITVTAGVFGVNFFLFMIATIVGRSARFFLVSALLYKFGEPVRDFIDRRFNVVTIVFAVLLVGGFYVLRFVGH